MASYVEALKREMSLRKQYIKGTRVHNIYIGGGTPSLLPSCLLQELYEAIARLWTIDEDAEVTIEANPDDVTREWLRGIEGTPVNRISMGAQTFSDRLLRFSGRRHNAQQTIDAVRACKEAGITNISLDLIYGLPGQTFEDWQRDVEQALSLGITHLSAYALSYEEGTRLEAMLRAGQVPTAFHFTPVTDWLRNDMAVLSFSFQLVRVQCMAHLGPPPLSRPSRHISAPKTMCRTRRNCSATRRFTTNSS